MYSFLKAFLVLMKGFVLLLSGRVLRGGS